jgi:hypothetical protein
MTNEERVQQPDIKVSRLVTACRMWQPRSACLTGTNHAGGILLHLACLMSLALLILNDRFLKEHWSNWVTGKLSDFAGLALFSFLIFGAAEIFRRTLRMARWWMRPTGIVASSATIALLFLAIKTSSLGASFFKFATGILEWPIYAMMWACRGKAVAHLPSAHIVRDPSDGIALIALAIPALVAWKRYVRNELITEQSTLRRSN